MPNFNEKSLHSQDFYEDLEQAGKLFALIRSEDSPEEDRLEFAQLYGETKITELLVSEAQGEQQFYGCIDKIRRELILFMRLQELNQHETKILKQFLVTPARNHSLRSAVIGAVTYFFIWSKDLENILSIIEACFFHNIGANIFYHPTKRLFSNEDTLLDPGATLDLVYLNVVEISMKGQELIALQNERYREQSKEEFTPQLEAFLFALECDYMSLHVIKKDSYSFSDTLLYITDSSSSVAKPVTPETVIKLKKILEDANQTLDLLEKVDGEKLNRTTLDKTDVESIDHLMKSLHKKEDKNEAA